MPYDVTFLQSVIPKPIEDVDQEGNIAALFNALKPSSLDQLSTLIMSIPNTVFMIVVVVIRVYSVFRRKI